MTSLSLLVAAAYVTPSIVAGSRGHPQFGPILVINVALGWTLVGWVAALAWSLSRIDGRADRRSALQRWEGK